MSEKERLEKIRKTIAQSLTAYGVKQFNIYLFGSRAKGLERDDSDYDIIVITHEEFRGKEKFKLLRWIRNSIKYLGLSIDIILKSTEEYSQARSNFGSFIYTIQNELVAI
ncbi:MAG: nucleotidyltransferase domain-containing protein [Acidobacteria bacterium]|jgi:predicted nucleotidyltransferase|nr:nucleotidyltransferase domain-containing protein [Acidobacteriota bacterium]